MGKNDGPIAREKKETAYQYCDMTRMSLEEFRRAPNLPKEEREKILQKYAQEEFGPTDTLTVVKMTLLEELAVMTFFLFGVPGGVFSIPVTIGIIGLLTGQMARTALIAALILVPLAIAPVKYNKSFVTSWFSFQIVRYFSFKFYSPTLDPDQPHILVRPSLLSPF
jgi:F420-0:gamma-glutamyl ligase-like protein